ncbi:MAG: hypothetical protein RJA44_2742 [Pseudomonadota bacterium]
MSNALQQLDPRRRLASAIGWAVVSIVTLAALLAAAWAAAQAEQRMRADAAGLLDEYATQVRDAASMTLRMRSALLQAAALQIGMQGTGAHGDLRPALQAVLHQFDEFDRLAVLDHQGRVQARVGVGRLPADPDRQAWFAAAQQQTVVSDALAAPERSVRELLVATPLPAPPGTLEESEPRLLLAVLPWSWFETVLGHMQEALGHARDLELMLAARDGQVLAGPEAWRGRNLNDRSADPSEGGLYLVGQRTQLRLADSLGLGWTVVVRERADAALATVRTLRHAIFVTVFLAGLAAAATAVLVTRMLLRRLQQLAQAAEAVQQGRREALGVPSGDDEIAMIGRTLAELVDHLQNEKRALQALNVELDQRVAERTARIERMSAETRLAAVSRERLRLARDLHDTLAHSLMALLTQIRLVRKLRTRLGEAELDAELERAEQAAAAGLVDARAAITQMRDNSVRETGLASALQDLARRFGQTSGLAVELQLDAAAQGWTDERFEAVFRIVEEALRNIERHAGAQRVVLAVRLDEGTDASAAQACLCVSDDGCGFDPEGSYPGHYGLRGMREQAALIGATLQLHSALGQGSRLELRLAL